MAKPWGGVGAWAAETERETEREAEELAAQSFPSLKEASSAKPKKKKMSLSEFYNSSGTPVSNRVGLTPDEMMRLPTGPKERSAEDMQYGRLGGGFSSYGRSGPNPGRDGDREGGDGSWGGGGRRSYGGFDDDRRGPPSRVSDFDQPSRADEVDNWAMTKKSLPSADSSRQSRYSSLGSGGAGGGGDGGMMGAPAWSRADEVDNWTVGKKPAPSRSSTFGSGFRDSGAEPDRWARGGREVDRVERERPKLVLDPPKGENEPLQVVKTNKPNPFGAARPREEILAEKGMDWKKLESEIEAKKTSRPTSAHSSRPSSAQSSRSEGPGLHGSDNAVKPRPKVNPFGDAKPREVLLEERGKDWRKIDLELEHQAIDRPETDEEKILREEIDHLKKELEKESTDKVNSETVRESGGDQPSLRDIVLQKERKLETLIRNLDDKVRFGQKAIDRPGSGAGRPGSAAGRGGSFFERTPSYSGSFEDSRSMEYVDGPPSQGKGDPWARPFDDRRSFHGGRERGGFLGNRDMDRARSRERW
ncbi:eukaryotic translation initiation factor 4B2-like [Pyrus x bretschneideri]|uniref:eukaryotic translation initiation factor 4B2-like n=1 Tax=Pyrus x bretschneideri TaxID=225117 RepID=UPI002030EB92|nr:eukaryotic translation initiation factor 4B2-like [Pyrus x bretschneideri]